MREMEKINVSLRRETEPVTVGSDLRLCICLKQVVQHTVYEYMSVFWARSLCTKAGHTVLVGNVAVTGSVFMPRLTLVLAQFLA